MSMKRTTAVVLSVIAVTLALVAAAYRGDSTQPQRCKSVRTVLD